MYYKKLWTAQAFAKQTCSIGKIYIGSGAARSDKGIMVVEQKLRLPRNTLNKRKETDKEYQDNVTRV